MKTKLTKSDQSQCFYYRTEIHSWYKY